MGLFMLECIVIFVDEVINMTKRIGVDIDAVLTDEGRGEENIWHSNICKYFDLTERIDNVYDFRDAYGLSSEEVEEFIAAKGLTIFREVPPRPRCKEVLSDLKEKDYSIILVTARPAENNTVTLEWLEEHQIPFDKLIHSEEKADVCKKEDIEFFIDDNPKHLIPIRELLRIPVLLMNMDHNQGISGEFIRVDNWTDIEKHIPQILE